MKTMNLVELVPRDIPSLISDAKRLTSQMTSINGINIPDVLRLPNRSFDMAKQLLNEGIFAVPHIRSIDRPVEAITEIVKDLVQHGLKSILIVSGDAPPEDREQFDIRPCALISHLKQTCPSLKIYAALDPYRQSLKDELAYCKEKTDAGADGFFTQPFFDVRLAEIYLEQLTSTDIFLGISPVYTEKSLNYWKTRNNVVFPPDFNITEDYNQVLGSDLVQLAKQMNQNTYLMPITADPFPYVSSVFNSLSIKNT